jgi:hypothetical protein
MHYDLFMATYINVTAEHIAKGVRAKGGDNCAVALAIREQLNTDVWVAVDYIEVGEAGHAMIEKVRNWCERYDAGEEVEPFTFRLPRVLW